MLEIIRRSSSFSVGFFSVFLFVLVKERRHFASPCTISKASARIFGEKLGLLGRWGPICIHLCRTFPGLGMGPRVWRTLHTGHAPSRCRTFALHLLMWAVFPRETVFLILRSFIYAGMSSTSSCCVRELIIFLSRYYFLPACFCLSSQWKRLCVHNARTALAPLITRKNPRIPQDYISGTPEASRLQSAPVLLWAICWANRKSCIYIFRENNNIKLQLILHQALYMFSLTTLVILHSRNTVITVL